MPGGWLLRYPSTAPASPGELNERAQYLLKALIERYINHGQPVGSRPLSREIQVDLSPATIRNVMADLEDMGYLYSPHTAAGRVPTARGYRFFVDSLMQACSLEDREVEELRRQLDPGLATGDLIQSVSSLLSGATRLAGIVTLPRQQSLLLRHVEFLPLADQRVLVILVVNEQEVQNRIIQVERPYSAAELQQAANYLNAEFSGREIREIRGELLQELQDTRESMDRLMDAVVEVADLALGGEGTEDDDYVVAGQTNLMGVADLADMEKLRQLFEAFQHKRDMLGLFDQCLKARGVQIFIGEEAGFDVLDDCSVVTASYSEGRVMGVLGVIGPTRMPYQRIVPLVEITAKLLASALNSRN